MDEYYKTAAKMLVAKLKTTAKDFKRHFIFPPRLGYAQFYTTEKESIFSFDNAQAIDLANLDYEDFDVISKKVEDHDASLKKYAYDQWKRRKLTEISLRMSSESWYDFFPLYKSVMQYGAKRKIRLYEQEYKDLTELTDFVTNEQCVMHRSYLQPFMDSLESVKQQTQRIVDIHKDFYQFLEDIDGYYQLSHGEYNNLDDVMKKSPSRWKDIFEKKD